MIGGMDERRQKVATLLVPFGYAGMAVLTLLATRSPRVIAIGTAVVATVTGAWFIFVAVRFVGSRTDPHHAKRPRDTP